MEARHPNSKIDLALNSSWCENVTFHLKKHAVEELFDLKACRLLAGCFYVVVFRDVQKVFPCCPTNGFG